MTTAIDLVETFDGTYNNTVHPRYKQEVGKRLALGALGIGYGYEVDYAAPRVSAIRQENSMITIDFGSLTNFSVEIKLLNNKGFEVCCDTTDCSETEISNWQPLTYLQSSNFLNFSSLKLKKPANCQVPISIRYLWKHKPCIYLNCSLYSLRSELPVLPFMYKISNENSNYNSHVSIVFFSIIFIQIFLTRKIQLLFSFFCKAFEKVTEYCCRPNKMLVKQ